MMNFVGQLFDHVRQAPVTLVLTLGALVLFALPESGNVFEFTFADVHWEGSSLDFGKLWKFSSQWRSCLRVVGCNWLHWSVSHLFWDTAMFYIVGSLCERRARMIYTATIAVSALMIPLSILVAMPGLSSYRGLSGIDTAIFALLATGLLFEHFHRRDWNGSIIYAGMLVAMGAKIGFEMSSHQNLFVVNDSFVPVPLAHLVGAILGVVFAGIGQLTRLSKQRQQRYISFSVS